MAVGKALNKKSFYGGNETGQIPDIAMPGYDETPAIASVSPDPWNPQEQTAFNNVPDEIPEDVDKELGMSEQEGSDNLTVDKISTVQQKEDHPNFRSIREAKERAERERDTILAHMIQMQSKLLAQENQSSNQQRVNEQSIDDDLDIDSESLVEGKHLKKVVNSMKASQKKMQEAQQVAEQYAIEAKIRAHYPDFERVVSQENIARLNEQFPDIADTLAATSDIYKKASAAYTVIKNFGIYKDATPYSADKQKAAVNAQKPRPLASVSPQQGDSPLSKANAFANGMTEELKEQLRREMYAARKAM